MNWKIPFFITLLCLFPVISAVAIGPEHSGSWYWDDQSGHGFSIEIGELPDGSPLGVAYWYTYDDQGTVMFLADCARFNRVLLNSLFEHANQGVTTYTPRGNAQHRRSSGLMNVQF